MSISSVRRLAQEEVAPSPPAPTAPTASAATPAPAARAPAEEEEETGKVVGYSRLFRNFLQFIVIHIVKGLSVLNEAEVDVFLQLPFFLI